MLAFKIQNANGIAGHRAWHLKAQTAVVLLLLIWTAGASVYATPLADLKKERPQRIVEARQALTRNWPTLGLGPKDTFEPRSSTIDPKGQTHVYFQRYHQGVRVIGAGVKVTVDGKGSATVRDMARREVSLPTVVPAVGEVAVKETVAQDLKILVPQLELATELVIVPATKDRTQRLAWIVRADAQNIRAVRYFVDATTGQILEKERANVEDSDVAANGFGQHHGAVSFMTRLVDSEGKYKLYDMTRGGTRVLNSEDKKPAGAFQGSYYWDSNTTWGNGQDWKFGGSTTDATGQTAAVDAMYGARITWDLWSNVFGRLGYGDDNGPMKVRVHYRAEAGSVYGDANYDGTYVNLGDGAESDSDSRTHLSTVAHELGHGLWHHAVTDYIVGEAGGLNEGHGDISASIAWHYAVLANGQGGTVPSASLPQDVSLFKWRSVNPLAYTAGGDTGLRVYVPPGGAKPMGEYEVHTQGTVYGRMFASLAAGTPSKAEYDAGSPCPNSQVAAYQCLISPLLPQGMAGIGIDKAAWIWYYATIAHLDETPNFTESRDAWLAAAQFLFGVNSYEYRSVMNAFKAVNIGEEAVDTEKPTVWMSVPQVHNDEQTAYVEVTSSDDIGVRTLKLTAGGSERVWPAGAFKGYIDLSRTQYGKAPLSVIARDAVGNEAQASQTVSYKGANYAIQNRGFEDGGASWQQSAGGMIRTTDAAGAFLGKAYASFSGSNEIRQSFSPPEATTYCSVGLRVQVRQGEGMNQSAMLLAEVMGPNGITVQQVIAAIPANTNTTDPTSNNYKAWSQNVAGCNSNRSIRIRSVFAGTDQFRVDNVYVTYTAPVTAQLEAVADANEGSLIVQVKNIQNVVPEQVKEVRWLQGGKVVLTDRYAPYLAIQALDSYSAGVTYSVSAQVMDHIGTPWVTVGPADFSFLSLTQLIQNGTFENGLTSWSNGGATGACYYNPAGGQGPAAFIGTGCAYFTGTGYVEQTFAVPPGLGTATLTFRLDMERLSAAATLEVEAINAATGISTLLHTIPGNTDTKASGITHKNYRRYTSDLSAFAGKNVKVRFKVTDNGATPIVFYLDNIGVGYKPKGIVIH